MKKFNVSLELYEENVLYGMWMKSNDKTISKDIPSLSEKYYKAVQKEESEVLPFYVLSRNYTEKTGDFELFIGSTIEKNHLESYTLKQGKYAKLTVRPKLGFLWGIAIGEAKRFFYTKWMPSSGYQPLNMEYELHTEKSIGKSATVDIIFGISENAR